MTSLEQTVLSLIRVYGPIPIITRYLGGPCLWMKFTERVRVKDIEEACRRLEEGGFIEVSGEMWDVTRRGRVKFNRMVKGAK